MNPQEPNSLPQGFKLVTGVEVKGAKNFHIEVLALYKEPERPDVADIQIRLIANRDKRQWAILPLPAELREAPFPFDKFDISPDERILLASRKVCSGTNEMFLFNRYSNLHYRLPVPNSLNKQITRHFGKKSKQWSGGVEILVLMKWEDKGRTACLNCHYGDRGSDANYTVLLDTHTGMFHRFRRV